MTNMKPLLLISAIFLSACSAVKETTPVTAPVTHGIVFVGDSITEFEPLALYYSETPIYNEGGAGQGCTQIRDRFAATLDKHPDADTVVLQCGANDLYLLGFDADHILADISKMVTIAQQKNKRLILETLTPAVSGVAIKNYSDQQIKALISPVDARILALGVPVADCNKVLGVSGALIDGLHPSAEGYKLLSAEVERVMLTTK